MFPFDLQICSLILFVSVEFKSLFLVFFNHIRTTHSSLLNLATVITLLLQRLALFFLSCSPLAMYAYIRICFDGKTKAKRISEKCACVCVCVYCARSKRTNDMQTSANRRFALDGRICGIICFREIYLFLASIRRIDFHKNRFSTDNVQMSICLVRIMRLMLISTRDEIRQNILFICS